MFGFGWRSICEVENSFSILDSIIRVRRIFYVGEKFLFLPVIKCYLVGFTGVKLILRVFDFEYPTGEFELGILDLCLFFIRAL